MYFLVYSGNFTCEQILKKQSKKPYSYKLALEMFNLLFKHNIDLSKL